MGKIKDTLMSHIISRVLSIKIEDYSETVNFSIDSKDKSINVELLLKGEEDTIKIEISQYSLLNIEGKTYITSNEVYTSREWLNILIKKYLPRFLPEKRIEIPSDYAKLAKLLF